MSKTSSYWTISDSTFVTTESCENKRAALNAYPWDGSLREVTGPMLQLNNNKFLGYNRPECPTPVVRMDLFGLSEQAYASSIAMRGTDSQYGLNFCESKNANLDLWIADADGSLRPQGLSGSGQGTLLTNMDHLVNFVDPNQCQESPSDCTTYCNACFRSVIVSMSKTPIKYRLKVCLASDHGNCVYFNSFDTTQNPDNGNTRWYAHLPPGKYVGHLVDSNGKYVEKDLDILMSAEMCSGAIQQDDFTLVTEPLEGGKDPAPAPTPAPGLRPTRSPVRGVPEEETDSDDGYDYDDGNVEEVAETDGYDDDEEEEEEEEEEADEADEEEEAEEEEESNCKGLFCGMGNK